MVFFTLLFLAASWTSWKDLVNFSLQNESATHILLIPFVSIFLLIVGRKNIFAHVRTARFAGISLVLAGAGGYWLAHRYSALLGRNDRLSAAIFSLLVLWLGGFILCFGARTFRAGIFPALFLLLMVPIPQVLLTKAILFLQAGSAKVAYDLFHVCAVPVYRDGFSLSLPGITIEVAEECSGIRSSIALFITSLLAGHLYLRKAWTKALLCSTVIPLVIVKNGIRIVTLTLLSLYVDRGFLSGNLHHEGGVVFFLVALGILVSVLWLLQRGESARREEPSAIQSREAGSPPGV